MKNTKFILTTVCGIVLILVGVLFFLNYLGVNTNAFRFLILGIICLAGYLVAKSKVFMYLSFYILPIGLVSFLIQFISKDSVGISYALIGFSIGLSFYLTYCKTKKSVFKYLTVISSLVIYLYIANNFLNSLYNYVGMGLMILATEFALFHICDIDKSIMKNFVVSVIFYILATMFLLRGASVINQTVFMAAFAGSLVVIGVAIIVYMLYKDKKEI